MKTNKYNKVLVGVFSLLLPLSAFLFTSCEDKLELTNPNQQTTATFGNTADDLEECVIAAYNHIRMEGSYARVGYTIDLTRGDEVWYPPILTILVVIIIIRIVISNSVN